MWREGGSLTPFVGLALSLVGGAESHVERAALAGLAMLGAEGAIGLSGAVRDYPVYATGMLLSLCAGAGQRGTEVARAATWLQTQQRGPSWDGHPARGGFGMGEPVPPVPPNPGHVDISMTRRAVEGLAAVGALGDEARLPARAFVASACRADGACVYSPVEEGLNKGVQDGEKSSGYGSATTDAVLARLALGETVNADDAAVLWLAAHFQTGGNPGMGPAHEGFAAAMSGYWRAGVAEVFARVGGGPAGWAEALIAAVLREQRVDGSWRNTVALQKEDDPLVATAFALRALHFCGAGA